MVYESEIHHPTITSIGPLPVPAPECKHGRVGECAACDLAPAPDARGATVAADFCDLIADLQERLHVAQGLAEGWKRTALGAKAAYDAACDLAPASDTSGERFTGADLREWAARADLRTSDIVRLGHDDVLWLADRLDELAAARALRQPERETLRRTIATSAFWDILDSCDYERATDFILALLREKEEHCDGH